MLQDILDGKIQNLCTIFKILSEISRIPWPHPPKAYHETSRCPLFETWYLYSSSTKLDDFIFICTVSCIDSQKCNDYYCETCKFSWIKCQKYRHIQFVSQFSNIQWSIYPYLPGIKHSYFICIIGYCRKLFVSFQICTPSVVWHKTRGCQITIF